VLDQLATRIAGPSSGPLAIRGAAVGRVRRNAISLNGDRVLPGTRVAVGKPLEVWRRFVQKRWNPQSRFLNLEVSRIQTNIVRLPSRFKQRMSEDEMISKAGLLPPGIPGGTGKEASVIFKLASQLKPPVRFLSLSLLILFSHLSRFVLYLSPTITFKPHMSSQQSHITSQILPISLSRTTICVCGKTSIRYLNFRTRRINC
jgi:nuclear RNA export factor